jgi:hypothetical protein
METPGPLPERLASALAVVPGVVAVALGGSRAIGAAHAASDYDIGLYFSERAGLGVDRLLEVVKGLVDEPAAAQVTEVSGWGPWIVGGGWLTIEAMKVDLLYRPIESVDSVVNDCRQGRVSVDYQPGHPHGFCSAIWMGEVELCRPLSDPEGAIARLKAMTLPYPKELGEFAASSGRSYSASRTRRRPCRRAMRPTSPGARSDRWLAPRKRSSRSTDVTSSMKRARSPQRRGCQ